MLWRHWDLFELIEKRAITYIERFSGPFAVPAIGLHNLQDDLSLDLAHRLPGNLFKRNLPAGGNCETKQVRFSSFKFGKQRFLGAEHNVALHQVFKLANISRPVILLHAADGEFRKLGCTSIVLIVVFAAEIFRERGYVFQALKEWGELPIDY